MHPYTNRLINETSPYLLQHAHNPVDWFPWGEEAFNKSKEENKPILVSIGYAACHWCHVMERESFEDPQVAAIMNQHFVNIKVDREERPDVDHIYMDAVQAISGSGGWPLNVFLTPDKKPFYGGTYFPPRRAFNRSSWPEVLEAIAKAYKEGQGKIEEDAETLTEHLKKSNAFGTATNEIKYNRENVATAFQNMMKTADTDWGGFGKAPKFPQTFSIIFLLRYAHLNKNEVAKVQALLCLDKMMQGGLYDHAGGGFARYATDAQWLAPHFEKMLYDNALLVMAYTEAYSLTKEEKYKEVIEETLAFIERELMHSDGGFYSALDADSEGEEGKFYVWTYEEVMNTVLKDPSLFCRYFDISEEGNWEGKNILFVKTPVVEFAEKENKEVACVSEIVAAGKKDLLEKRSERIRPQLDDKILLGWNALMTSAYCKAYAVLGKDHYLEVAKKNIQFLFQNFQNSDSLFFHTWKGGAAKYPAFIDDYSYLIAALLDLGQVSSDFSYFVEAEKIATAVVSGFSDSEDCLFYFTHKDQEDVLLRKKEVYDGATPSGNATMAFNLYQLGIILNNEEWSRRSEKMVSLLADLSIKYPTSFGVWLNIYMQMVYGTDEVAIIGVRAHQMAHELWAYYFPNKIVMIDTNKNENFPLLQGRFVDGETLIYLCRNYACQRPVKTVAGLLELLR